MNRLAYHDAIGRNRRGLVASPSGLGQPTPTGSRVCDNTTLRSSGARGLDVSRCYRHIAPLERKAPTHQNSNCIVGLALGQPIGFIVLRSSGGALDVLPRSSSERGWGTSNAYGFNGVRQYHIALLWSAGVGRVALL